MHELQHAEKSLFRRFAGAVRASVIRLMIGVLRWQSSAAWDAQVLLFLVGAWIEWLLIADLFGGIQKKNFPFIALAHYVPAHCALVLIVHQFLIFRNAEVEREHAIAWHAVEAAGWPPHGGAPESPRARVRLANYILSMGTAFLLAAITGEVPYLVSLLFFTSEAAPGHMARYLDFLNMLPKGPNWDGTNWDDALTLEQLRVAIPLFYKAMFFGASALLACVVIGWDLLRRKNSASEYYASSIIKIRIWVLFLISDFVSLVVWVCLFITLWAVVGIQNKNPVASSVAMTVIIIITSVTVGYSLVICFRILTAVFSSESAQTIRNRIV